MYSFHSWKPRNPNCAGGTLATLYRVVTLATLLATLLPGLRAWATLSSFWCNLIILQTLCSPNQPSATRPIFGTNLHFRQFLKTVNHEFRFKFRGKCLKWRFVPKRGWVADGCPKRRFWWPNERLGTHFRSTFQRASTRFGLRSLEINFEMRSQMLVRPSKIFVA